MENSCRITIGKKFWKNHFFELRSRLQQQDTKARASKCWFLRKTGGHTWWQWFRIVPGAVLSIESKNGVRISKNKKCNFFAFYQNLEKLSKGGTLWIKKIQSAPIWTKLAGLVGTIKKTSWEVILKFACTLLGSERPKTKNDAKGVPLEQKKFKVLQSGRNLQDW